MKIANFDEVVAKLRPFLGQYLEEHGYDTSKNFSCFMHEDKHPSCSINGNGRETYHCFQCNSSGNIFDAAHILDNLPLAGKAFITDNLLVLAKKYNIEVNIGELTEEEIYELDTYRAYKVASQLITRTERTTSYANDRGLQEDVMRAYCVGGITSFSDFRNSLKQYEFSAKFLDDIDLGRKDIFNEDSLIFTIHDEVGRPVGFAARNLNYDGKEENGSKYINQKTTGLKCNIYQKGRRLYGLHKADPAKPLYIFEGYVDVLTASTLGVNCCAIGGTALTNDHLMTLRENNFYDIILVLDSDSAGQKRTQEILDNKLANIKDIKIRVLSLPENTKDPDEFLLKYGVDAFNNLTKWSAFEWRLNRIPEDADSEEVCNQMISFIVNETNHITQEQMCRTLHQRTGFSLSAIQSELKRRLSLKDADQAQSKELVIKKLVYDFQRHPENAEILLLNAQQSLRNLNLTYNTDSYSFESCVSDILTQKSSEEAGDEKFCGFTLGKDLAGLQNALPGQWKKDVLLLFGGRANAGKSALLSKLAYSIASNPIENDAIVIYHSIDDTKEQMLPRFVSIADGSKQLELNHIMFPKYYSKSIPDLFQKRSAGYQKVSELARDKYFMLRDANHGNSLAYIESLLSRLRQDFPTKNIVYILDNLHKVPDMDKMGDDRVRWRNMSQTVKGLATAYHVCFASTVEYTKLPFGTRPTDDNIAETVQLQYDANLIVHLWNELHELRDRATLFHVDSQGNKLPRLELLVGKSKITAFKGSIFLDFFPACSDFTAVLEGHLPQQYSINKSSGMNIL